MEKQFKIISKSPDVFNQYFSSLGWIAHESMNYELMIECIEYAKNNSIDKAEEKLAEYYTSENLKWLAKHLKTTPEFRKRYNLILHAYNDTIAKRYYSSIPLILMIIDGGVNDINKNKGFFTETTDLTAWDSIAAHSSGLSKLRDILNIGRNKTNTEEIFLPYRNGILHGRDIFYENKFVAAKCWLTLIAINDWAIALKKSKEKSSNEQSKVSFKQSIISFNLKQEKRKTTHELIEKWKKRNIILDVDFPSKGSISDYKEYTPEKDAINFLLLWEKKNYGEMAKQISYHKKDVNLRLEAGRIRNIFEKKNLIEYRISSIEDCSPAISEVYFIVIFEYRNKIYEKKIKMRMIYQNENGDYMILGQVGGNWKIIDSFFFHEIEYP